MEEKILECIKNEMLLNDNKKINEKWTLKEYLKSFDIKQLTMMAVIHFWENQNFESLLKIKNMANKKKGYVVNYVFENIEEIIKTYVKILPKHILNQLNNTTKNIDIISYNLYENIYSLQFLIFLKKTMLGRVYLDTKSNMIQIYIPNEFKNIIKMALKDKNIIKENNKYNEIYKFTIDCMNVYGILTMDELYTLCSKFKLGVNIDELNTILNSYMFVDEEFNLYEFNDTILVANIEFDASEAIDFYKNSNGDLNGTLTLNDIRKIGDYKYIYKLKSYKKLINWLDDRYEGIKEDHKLFDELIIFDYINSAQTSLETANKNFKENIEEFLEIDIFEKNIVGKMLEDIFKECPKWKKRGNI